MRKTSGKQSSRSGRKSFVAARLRRYAKVAPSAAMVAAAAVRRYVWVASAVV
jgi:hypothetical protein